MNKEAHKQIAEDCERDEAFPLPHPITEAFLEEAKKLHRTLSHSNQASSCPPWVNHAYHVALDPKCHLCCQQASDFTKGRCILHSKQACPTCAKARRKQAIADKLLHTPKPTMWHTVRCQAGQVTLDNAHDAGVVIMCEAPAADGGTEQATLSLTASQAISLAVKLLESVEDEIVDPPEAHPVEEGE